MREDLLFILIYSVSVIIFFAAILYVVYLSGKYNRRREKLKNIRQKIRQCFNEYNDSFKYRVLPDPPKNFPSFSDSSGFKINLDKIKFIYSVLNKDGDIVEWVLVDDERRRVSTYSVILYIDEVYYLGTVTYSEINQLLKINIGGIEYKKIDLPNCAIMGEVVYSNKVK